jgi:hypothetical protein
MPQVPYDILDRIRDLEQQVRDLTGRSQIRPAMNQVLAGDVVVGQGGTFKVNDVDGDPMFYVGGISPLNPDGSPQRGLLAYRQDGSLAVSIANSGTGPMTQTVAVRDKNGNVVVSDDVVNGGLGRPYLPVPMQPGVDFTDATWRHTHVGWWHVQHPNLTTNFSVFAPGGTTAQARLVKNVAGAITQLGSTITATGGETFGNFTLTPADHGGAFGTWVYLMIQVQRTAGTGTCTSWNGGMYGSN